LAPLFEAALVINVAMLTLATTFETIGEQRLADRFGVLAVRSRRSWRFVQVFLAVAILVPVFTQLWGSRFSVAAWLNTCAILASVLVATIVMTTTIGRAPATLTALWKDIGLNEDADRLSALSDALRLAIQHSDTRAVNEALALGLSDESLAPGVRSWLLERQELLLQEWLAKAVLDALADEEWQEESTAITAQVLDGAIALNNPRLTEYATRIVVRVLGHAKTWRREEGYLLTEAARILWTLRTDPTQARHYVPEWLESIQQVVLAPIAYLDGSTGDRPPRWTTAPEFLESVVCLAASIAHADLLSAHVLLERIERRVKQGVEQGTLDIMWF